MKKVVLGTSIAMVLLLIGGSALAVRARKTAKPLKTKDEVKVENTES